MLLYFMRHGIAFEPSEWEGSEFDRPLTDEGATRTRRILKALHKEEELAVDAIWTSPLVRALQTAKIAEAELGAPLTVVPALQCGADLDALLADVKHNSVPERLLCVGHEPDLGHLVADLTGDSVLNHEFKKAGVAKLEGKLKRGKMTLVWYKAPKDVLGD
jgi:phosphohistidine phosphatase